MTRRPGLALCLELDERSALFLRLLEAHYRAGKGEIIKRALVREANAIGLSTLADLNEKGAN